MLCIPPGAGKAAARMMLGQPIALVAEPVADFGQLQGFGNRIRRTCTRSDRRLVEHAELHVKGMPGLPGQTVRQPSAAGAPPALERRDQRAGKVAGS